MGTAGVFKLFSRIQNGLFSHHTFSFDFFRFTIAVGDNPMATKKLNGLTAVVFNSDFIGKNKVVFLGIRMVLQEKGFRLYL